MLDCCEPLEKVKSTGISFGKVVCLAHCAGAKVKAFRSNHSTIDDFRKYVMECSASEDCHVISSYHRGTFEQVIYVLRFLAYFVAKNGLPRNIIFQYNISAEKSIFLDWLVRIFFFFFFHV